MIAKLFLVDNSEWSLSLGIGAENNKIDGAVSIGGFKLPTTGEGWSPVLQIAGSYKITERISIGLGYERRNVRTIVTILRVPNLETANTGGMFADINLKIF